MGVLNVTPDSFSDGGCFSDASLAIERGKQMAAEGADIIDVGGESTRPGAAPVSSEIEIDRVIPVVKGLVEAGLTVSVDTSKAEVAREALIHGANIINDVMALAAPGMAETCAEHGCTVCLMHMKGEPRTMQLNPEYLDVVSDVYRFLEDRVEFAVRKGIARSQIWVDPGFGFGKTVQHNVELLRRFERFTELGLPVVVGVSRKSFLGKLLGDLPVEERLEATLAAQVIAQMKGAGIIRVHDTLAAKRAMDIASFVIGASAL